MKGLAGSIQHLDSRVGAIALVLDDIVRGGVENVTKLSPVDLGLHEAAEHPQLGGVHWPGYIRMYLKQVDEELAQLRAKQAAPFDPFVTPEAENQSEDDDVVFGGDDKNGETSAGQSTGTTG